MSQTGRWTNSILRYGEEAPDQLLANPQNWRIHPASQKDALIGSLNELGWITPVIVNETTGNLVDGHARVGEAIARGEAAVPVAYVRLTPAQEALALATLDPISAMAAADREQFARLLDDVNTGEAGLQALLDSLAVQTGIAPPDDPLAEWQGMPEFEQPDTMPYRTVAVHFADDNAVEEFARLIGQNLTDKTKFVWYPEQQRREAGGQYVSDVA